MTRLDFSPSSSFKYSPKIGGTICHDRPNLSLEPATSRFLAASRKLLPEVIDLLLRLAAHEERDGFRELELRPAVQRVELLAIEHKGRGHRGDADNLRVPEDGRVKCCGLLGLAVEPQERSDLLHEVLLSAFRQARAGESNMRERMKGLFMVPQ